MKHKPKKTKMYQQTSILPLDDATEEAKAVLYSYMRKKVKEKLEGEGFKIVGDFKEREWPDVMLLDRRTGQYHTIEEIEKAPVREDLSNYSEVDVINLRVICEVV
jgi:hypothetical protein